jgi:acyl carrier protein
MALARKAVGKKGPKCGVRLNMGWFRESWESLLTQLLETDRNLLCALRCRPYLTDEEFFERFYSDSGIPKEIPIRLRQLWAEQLGGEWYGVEPSDEPARIYWTLDLVELIYEVEEEFVIRISKADWQLIGSSFDSFVHYVAERLAQAPRGKSESSKS